MESHSTELIAETYRDIRREIFSADPVIDLILDRIFNVTGKGVRPVFISLAAELLGGTWKHVGRVATVVEAVHVASLIHDDLIDGSELRRGIETLNVQYSERTSVLYGDYIFMKALDLAGTLPVDNAERILHAAVERMIRGEIRETLSGASLGESDYLKIIANKTASLFGAAGELSALLITGDDRDAAGMADIGENIGIAFQIIDDALDVSGETVLMGKRRFMDLETGCVTLPLIHVMRDMSERERTAFLRENTDTVVTAVHDGGGIEYAYARAADHLDVARNRVSRITGGEIPSRFESFLETVLERTR